MASGFLPSIDGVSQSQDLFDRNARYYRKTSSVIRKISNSNPVKKT